MKKVLFTLVVILAFLANGQAQEKLKIGDVKNGKLNVTGINTLKAFFMKSLENSGSLAKDFQVSTSPEGDRFLVYYPVSGNKDRITNIGVMLVKINNEAFIVENPPVNDAVPGGGGSFEIQCIGVDCNSCVPNIKWVNGTWLPLVYCECKSGSGTCNMISKLIVHVDI